MNEAQQQTLRKHRPDLVRDLELTPELVTRLIHHGIFNEDMIEEIKNVKTRPGQIHELLLRLPRRGPRAFDMFIHSIQDSYHWLADELRKTHHEISHKKGSEAITLKELVAINVHEKFGQSKRLCEEDKKEIRKFLYKQLKSHTAVDGLHYDVSSRRNSIQSDVSDGGFNPHDEPPQEMTSTVNTDVNVNEVLKHVYVLLNGQSEEELDLSEREITVDMIEKKATELNRKVEELQNEMHDCYSVLGLADYEYPLHVVLETYKEKNQSQVAELAKFHDRVEKLKKKRDELEKDLKVKGERLEKCLNDLANEEHENEKSKLKIENLKSECTRLNEIQSRHMEKQQTLLALKGLVRELKPITLRESQEHIPLPYGSDEVDGGTLHLPKLSQHPTSRSTRLSRRSGVRESTHHNSTHHEYQKPKGFGSSAPRKYYP